MRETPLEVDYIHNNVGEGDVAQQLLNNDMDHRVLRPFIGNDGRSYRNVWNARTKKFDARVHNVTATLRKDEWKVFDDAIVPAATERLNAIEDLRSAGLTFNIPDGMGSTVLETETMSQVTDAKISMDGRNETEADAPVFELTSLPLPIISKGFSFSSRQLATSRKRGVPLDTSTAEECARRVAEKAEKLLTGIDSTYSYGGGTVYGYTNHVSRNTKTDITAPTASGWTPETTTDEILEMRQLAEDDFHYGPYNLYFSTAWSQYLDKDFKANGSLTLRERISKIDKLRSIKTLDFLSSSSTAFVMVLVQATSNVIREVVAMDITTLQWPSMGGLQFNFKVMGILVPQLRADINGNMGLVHGTTS
jgi:uncharacterized linocin/CFP29 family protein